MKKTTCSAKKPLLWVIFTFPYPGRWPWRSRLWCCRRRTQWSVPCGKHCHLHGTSLCRQATWKWHQPWNDRLLWWSWCRWGNRSVQCAQLVHERGKGNILKIYIGRNYHDFKNEVCGCECAWLFLSFAIFLSLSPFVSLSFPLKYVGSMLLIYFLLFFKEKYISSYFFLFKLSFID
jgi:hypothetical protein